MSTKTEEDTEKISTTKEENKSVGSGKSKGGSGKSSKSSSKKKKKKKKKTKSKNKVGPSSSEPIAGTNASDAGSTDMTMGRAVEPKNSDAPSISFELDHVTETEILVGGKEVKNLETIDLVKNLANREAMQELNSLPAAELYYGMYRHYDVLEKVKSDVIPFQHTEAYCNFFQHPPNPLKFWFFTDGYYIINSAKEKKKIRICNLPAELQRLPFEVRKAKLHELFPTAEVITVDRDTATMVYGSQKEAETAYKKANLVKLQGQGLAWVTLKELYIINVPASMPERELRKDFSTAVSIKFLPGPNATKVAILEYNTDEEVEEVYNESKMIKLGNNQLAWYGTGSREDALCIQNLPEGVTDDDLLMLYPTAISISIGKQKTDKRAYHIGALASTLAATVQFNTNAETEKIFKQSKFVKMGHLKLCWTHPNELYLSGVPVGITTDDIRQIVGDVKTVKLLPQEDKRMTAVLKYDDEKAADTAYKQCQLQKLGYHWLSAAEMRDTVTITNVPKYNFNIEEVKKMFPNHRDVQVAPDDEVGSDYNKVLIAFGTETMADDGYHNAPLVKVDEELRILTWIRPDEIVIVDPPPDLDEDCLRKVYPGVKKLHHPYDERYWFATFESAEACEKAIEKSKLQIIYPHRVLWDEAYSPKFSGNPDDLRSMWKIPQTHYSNISNLFTFAVEITNLPPGMTMTQIFKHFHDANRISMPDRGDRSAAILEYRDLDKAVAAYIKVRNTVIQGRRLHARARTFYLNDTIRRQYENGELEPKGLSYTSDKAQRDSVRSRSAPTSAVSSPGSSRAASRVASPRPSASVTSSGISSKAGSNRGSANKPKTPPPGSRNPSDSKA